MFQLGQLDFAKLNLRDTSIAPEPALWAIFGFYPLGALGVLGLLTRRARRAPLWLWLIPVALSSTLFVTSFMRFRAALDPFFVLLAAAALATAADAVAARRRARRERVVQAAPLPAVGAAGAGGAGLVGREPRT
jgi:hypothetical protein